MVSHKIQEHQATKRNEAAQDDTIPPLLCPNLSNQTIHPGYLTRGTDNPPIHIRKHLSLPCKVLIDRISLAEYPVDCVVASVYPPSLLKHVIGFCVSGVGGPVSIDVGADIGEQVDTVAGGGDLRLYAGEFYAVLAEYFAMAGEVVLFERGCR